MDIIFFAAVAIYIFFKLRAQLGKIDEDEKQKIEEKIIQKQNFLNQVQEQLKQEQQKIFQIGESQNQSNEEIASSLDVKSKEHFLNILKSCNISAKFFMQGAESSFQMVIKAFAAEDLETLKLLLSEKIYQGFASAINQRKAQKHTLVSNLISFTKSEVTSALMIDNNASITIKFVSKQINYITDSNNNVIEGGKDDIVELTDIWTFKRDTTSANPNWLVVSTNS